MSRAGSIALAAGAVALFGAAVGLTQSNRAAAENTPKPQPVSVVNPSLLVSATSPSAVTLQADAAVTNGFSGSVVGGKTALVVQEANNAQHPFLETLDFAFASGDDFTRASLQVPAGKRAVIETFSVIAGLPSGQHLVSAYVTSTGPGLDGNVHPCNVWLAPVRTGVAAGNDIFIATQAMHMYGEPGTTLTLNCIRDASTNGAGINATVTGYLVDTP
jgi:hypothetical protein